MLNRYGLFYKSLKSLISIEDFLDLYQLFNLKLHIPKTKKERRVGEEWEGRSPLCVDVGVLSFSLSPTPTRSLSLSLLISISPLLRHLEMSRAEQGQDKYFLTAWKWVSYVCGSLHVNYALQVEARLKEGRSATLSARLSADHKLELGLILE